MATGDEEKSVCYSGDIHSNISGSSQSIHHSSYIDIHGQGNCLETGGVTEKLQQEEYNRIIEKENLLVKENRRLQEQLNFAEISNQVILKENADLKEKLMAFDAAENKHAQTLEAYVKVNAELDICRKNNQRFFLERQHYQEQTAHAEQKYNDLKESLAATDITKQYNELKAKLDSLSELYDMHQRMVWDRDKTIAILEQKLKLLKPKDEQNIQRKTKRFQLRRCRERQCKRCKKVLLGSENDWPCSFHTMKPQPYAVWKNHEHADNVSRGDGVRYWPCCNQYSKYEPEGCAVHMDHVV